jgi:hypothetical protein
MPYPRRHCEPQAKQSSVGAGEWIASLRPE